MSFFSRKGQRFQPPFSGEQPFAPTKESHNRLKLSSRDEPARDLSHSLPSLPLGLLLNGTPSSFSRSATSSGKTGTDKSLHVCPGFRVSCPEQATASPTTSSVSPSAYCQAEPRAPSQDRLQVLRQTTAFQKTCFP